MTDLNSTSNARFRDGLAHHAAEYNVEALLNRIAAQEKHVEETSKNLESGIADLLTMSHIAVELSARSVKQDTRIDVLESEIRSLRKI